MTIGVSAQTQPTTTTNPALLYKKSSLPFCPITNGDCFAGNQPVTNRTSVWAASAATTQNFESSLGAATAEVNSALNATFGTGYTAPWAPNTGYAAGDERMAHGGLYVATLPKCISAPTGSGPSGMGNDVGDGTCRWKYETDINAAGKINLGVFTRVPPDTDPNHPRSSKFNWGIYNSLFIQGETPATFWSGMEIAITNEGPDCGAVVGQSCTGLQIDGFVKRQGGVAMAVSPSMAPLWKPGTQYSVNDQVVYGNRLYVQTIAKPNEPPRSGNCTSASGTGGLSGMGQAIADGSCSWRYLHAMKPAWVYGLLFNGSTAEVADIAIEDDAAYAIAIGDIDRGIDTNTKTKILHQHAKASIFEQSESPVGVKLAGAYDIAAIDTTGAATGADGKPPIALRLGLGQEICLSGNNDCLYSDVGTPTFAARTLALRGDVPKLVLQDGSGSGGGWRMIAGANRAGSGELVVQSTPNADYARNATNYITFHPPNGPAGGSIVKMGTLLQLAPNTVASLPSCGTSTRGSLAYVEDASNPAYNTPPAGGGSDTALVFCNGSRWAVH